MGITRKFRKALAVVGASALALTAAACSGGTEPADPADPASPADPEVTMTSEGVDDGSTLTLWTRAPLEKQANLLVEAYNAAHENQVELTVVPNDDYVAKVGAAAGSDGLPDLFAADIVYVPNWASEGLFQDLTGQIDSLDYKDQINEGHLEAGTVDGKQYVLPFVLDLSMLFWNKDLFEEAGLDPEKAPATMQEYADAAKAVQALGKDGVYGTASGFNCGGCLVFTWFPSVWASGDEVMNEEGTESMLAGESFEEILTIWKDLWDSGAVAPSTRDEAGPTWTAPFTEGKVGLMFYPATLLSSTPFEAGVAGIPGVDGGASTFVGGDGIGISKDSEKTAQAWHFLNWLMSEEAQVEVLGKNKDATSRADFADNQYSSEDERLITINEVAAQGSTPISKNFQQAFNAPNSPWLVLIRNFILEGTDTLEADNEEITAVLEQ